MPYMRDINFTKFRCI